MLYQTLEINEIILETDLSSMAERRWFENILITFTANFFAVERTLRISICVRSRNPLQVDNQDYIICTYYYW